MKFAVEHPEITGKWHTESQYLVLLAARDEGHLFDLAQLAIQHELEISLYREPDFGNQITAIAIEPGDRTSRLLSDLPLALKEPVMV